MAEQSARCPQQLSSSEVVTSQHQHAQIINICILLRYIIMDVGLLSVQTDMSRGAAATGNTCNHKAICNYILVKDWQDQLLESSTF